MDVTLSLEIQVLHQTVGITENNLICFYIKTNFKTAKNMEIINIEKSTFDAMVAKFKIFVDRVDVICRQVGDKSLQKWLDNQDVCQILNISKRTLQAYRDNGILAYTQINHKMFYRPQDVEELICKLKNR